MIHKLVVGNFKSFRGTHEVPLGPLTLIYGPNSAGKSSLVQSILALRQLLDPSPSASSHGLDLSHHLNGPLVYLGGRDDIFHRDKLRGWASSLILGIRSSWEFLHSASFQDNLLFRWLFSTNNEKPSLEAVLTYKTEDLLDPDTTRAHPSLILSAVEYQIPRHQRPPSTLRFSMEHEHNENASTLLWRPPRPEELTSLLTWLHERWTTSEDGWKSLFSTLADPALQDGLRALVHVAETGSIDTTVHAIRTASLVRGRPEEPPLPLPTSPEIYAFSRVIQALTTTVRASLHELAYLGPLRTAPRRIVSMVDAGHPDIRPPFPSGESALRLLYSLDNAHEKSLNEWLERLDIPYTFRVRPFGDVDDPDDFLDQDPIGYECYFQRPLIQGHINPFAVGFGVTQLLPILIHGVVDAHETVIVEQPEIHLHPKQQGHLADFFLETEPQWIIETHSEALMLRIQRRIREGKVRPEDVTVLYVEPTPGGSQVLRLRLDDDGEFIDEWPNGFFEERFEDIFGGDSE